MKMHDVASREKSPALINHSSNRSSPIQCKGYPARTGYATQPVQHKANDTGLPDSLKENVEQLSGFSMDDVQVHYNSSKPAEFNAHAYTKSTDIHIGPRQEKHLPHEAWHVVQQKQGRVKATIQMKGVEVNNDNELEREADINGGMALAGAQSDPYFIQSSSAKGDIEQEKVDELQIDLLAAEIDEIITKLKTHSPSEHSLVDMADATTAVTPVDPKFSELENFDPGVEAHRKLPGFQRPVVQLAKETKKHDRNQRKRVKTLTAPLKTAGLTLAQKELRKKAKQLADEMDQGDRNVYDYKTHVSKKTKSAHPIWKILSQAQGMYSLLEKLNAIKENVRYFQNIDPFTSVIRRDMRARLTAGQVNLPIGSKPSTDDLYFDKPVLIHRKVSSRKNTLYIQGHLLNDHIGGAGLPHNLVPLTAEKKGLPNNTGSNNANGIHNVQIEEPIKKVLHKPALFYPGTQLHYRVTSLAPAGPRPHLPNAASTAQVKLYTTEFDTEVKDPANAGKKVKDIDDLIILKQPALKGIGSELIMAVGDFDTTPANMITLLQANADLWEEEDASIPAGIRCTAYYFDLNNIKTFVTAKDGKAINHYPVNNVLPTEYSAPYE